MSTRSSRRAVGNPSAVFRRGQSRRRNGTIAESSFNLVVSDRDQIAQQIPEALRFLTANASEVRRLVQLVGPENVVLDFGTGFRDVAAQSERLSAELIRAAASANVALEISIYAIENASGD